MAKCVLCGRTIRTDGKNYKETPQGLVHIKCPTYPLASDGKDYFKLMDRIEYHMINNARGFLAENTKINYNKLYGQIRRLKDKGYSYEEQLYALDKTVEEMNGFWGYKCVCDRADVIIGRKRKKDKVIEECNQHKVAQQPFDLSSIVIDDEEEW